MAEMGQGYGSECHLLRFMGRHRNYFDSLVRAKIGADAVQWLDFHFDKTKRWKDGERKGLDFLAPGHPALASWSRFWPSHGNQPNWDAVGVATFQGEPEWLLLEAKAHTGELISDCQAREEGGLPAIASALDATKLALGVSRDRNWLHRYYQFANRLTVLNFLREHQVPARLLFVYFLGDKFEGEAATKIDCPRDEAGWEKALSAQSELLGLDNHHRLSSYIHKIFVSVVV